MPFMNTIKNIGYVFVAIAGGIAVAHKTMALGDVPGVLAVRQPVHAADHAIGKPCQYDSSNNRVC